MWVQYPKLRNMLNTLPPFEHERFSLILKDQTFIPFAVTVAGVVSCGGLPVHHP